MLRRTPRCVRTTSAVRCRCQPACKPGSVGPEWFAPRRRDGHSSGTPITRRLKQPTRTAGLTCPAELSFQENLEPNSPLCRPYSVLLPVWFAMPPLLLETRCALTAPFHPYLRRGEGGSFSVALSLGSPPPDVIRHRMSMEPGLSSLATFRSLRERPSSRLTETT